MAADKEQDNGAQAAEEEVTEEAAAQQEEGQPGEASKTSAGKTINDAFKQVENLGKALSSALQDALQDRANVVMVRVNDDSLRYLDMLIEADITKSRSESAAFLINEGIRANETLFNKIREITDQIAALRVQLRETVKVEGE